MGGPIDIPGIWVRSILCKPAAVESLETNEAVPSGLCPSIFSWGYLARPSSSNFLLHSYLLLGFIPGILTCRSSKLKTKKKVCSTQGCAMLLNSYDKHTSCIMCLDSTHFGVPQNNHPCSPCKSTHRAKQLKARSLDIKNGAVA